MERAARADPLKLYYRIKHERKSIDAPVDTIGCDSVRDDVSDSARRFQILVSLLLSSRTRDDVTHEAVRKLNAEMSVLTPENVCSTRRDALARCIEKVGYHNVKLDYLIKISEKLKNKEMPDTLDDVVSLPGIGNKMGYLYMQHAVGRLDGIGVDTHVHRISNRIGLVRTSTPEKTRRELERVLDIEEWGDVNRVLVGYGQTICRAQRPKCADCAIALECPANQINR